MLKSVIQFQGGPLVLPVVIADVKKAHSTPFTELNAIM